jgi:integrase
MASVHVPVCRVSGCTTFGTRSSVCSSLELGTSPHVVQAIARHADLEITLSIYAHTNLAAMREALDRIEWEVE